MSFHRSPDSDGSSGGSPKATPVVHHTSAELTDDTSLLAVCKSASAAWADDSTITLKWITQPEFNALVTTFDDSFQGRLVAGVSRPGHTLTLGQLDDQLHTGGEEVKNYIRHKYKTEGAAAQFPRFGFVHRHEHWSIPADQDSRMISLGLMVTAITTDGFGGEEYGAAFWTQLQQEYKDALGAAGQSDKDVSGGVAGKNAVRPQLRKVLTALRFVLRGNYPDTYAQVWRQWGWQKEDY